MKKIIFTLALSFILVGAGCSSNRVEGDWYLNFDLPEEWTMSVRSTGDFYNNLHQQITRDLNEILLQDNQDLVYIGTDEEIPTSEDFNVRTENFTFIEVTRLDERRLIPREAEEISLNIFRNQLCGYEGRDCRDLQYEFEYFFEKEDRKFRFIITGDNIDQSTIENIITSSRLVTISE